MASRIAPFVLLCCWFSSATLLAQTPELIHCRQPVFRIPFEIEPGEQSRVREVQLYVSEDRGKSWRHWKTLGPTEKYFPFRCDRDGLYWFLVRTVDTQGRAYPAKLDGAEPGLRVLVDTQVPVVILRELPANGDQVGVEWEIREDNPDPSSFRIEYRPQGTSGWQTLPVEYQSRGRKYWRAASRDLIEVRVTVRDRAENQGSAYVQVRSEGYRPSTIARPGSPSAGSSTYVPPSPVPGSSPSSARRDIQVVNSPELTLNYALEEVGPSGLSLVELWYTRDGRSWQRYGEDPDRTSPFHAKLQGEGAYGLTLVVKSGVGLGDRPPQLGDQPQMWIEIDTTKPVVKLRTAEAGRGYEAGILTITWSAADKNLAPQPISLFYAENPEGPWNTIATALDNTGRYVWRIPPATPFRFYVRVEAIDRGGNVGRDQTAQPVIVDLSRPRGRLIGVEKPGS